MISFLRRLFPWNEAPHQYGPRGSFFGAVAYASMGWPKVNPKSDSNLTDLFWHALKVRELTGVTTWPDLSTMTADRGIEIVEFIDAHVVTGEEIRFLNPDAMMSRASVLSHFLDRDFSAFDNIHGTERYAVALSMWHGCICMAKTTRVTYRGKGDDQSKWPRYDANLRWHGYQILQRTWTEQLHAGNPWVLYGATLAYELSARRANETVTEWLPPESPYWWEEEMVAGYTMKRSTQLRIS